MRPSGVGGVQLLIAQLVSHQLTLLFLAQRHSAAFDQLNHMHAKARYKRLTDLVGLKGVNDRFKLWHKLARTGPAQIAALRSASILRVFACQRRKIGLARLYAAADVRQLLSRLGFIHLSRRTQQDVARAVLRNHRNPRGTLLNHLQDVKACAGAKHIGDCAFVEVFYRFAEEWGQAVWRAQAQLTTAGAVWRV